MNNLNIKIIFFDVGSVLLTHKEDFDVIASKFLGVDPQIYKEQLLEIIQSEECRQKYQAISNLEKERGFQIWINEQIIQRFNLELTDEKIAYLSNLRVNRTWNYRLLENVIDALDYLKSKYRLGIISNAPPSRRHFELKDFDLEKYFDPIIISAEVQSNKPEEKIFQIALELAGVEAGHSAMIDNKVENLQTAKKMGFSQCVLYNFDKVDQKKFLVVDNFIEFKEIF